jgi:hypothetical protein
VQRALRGLPTERFDTPGCSRNVAPRTGSGRRQIGSARR